MNGKELGLSIAKLPIGSTDEKLNFKLQIPTALNPEVTLYFTVSKTSIAGRQLFSSSYPLTPRLIPSAPNPAAPTSSAPNPAARTPQNGDAGALTNSQNTPLILRVKYASGHRGERAVGFLLVGDSLDKVEDVKRADGNPLILRGFKASPDGLYLDVGVAIPMSTKLGTYQFQLLDVAGAVVKVIDYKVE